MAKERIKNFLKDVFSINENKATKAEIKESIVAGAKLKGTNMCILILAIIIACVGLDLDSLEMLIGAMLISPMMGSIMGIAYALATGDFKFLRRAFAAIIIQMTICIITTTIYFLVTPIISTSAKLASFTTPTIWSVIIAIAGGLAAGIGVTRKEKGNILPGVAISTGMIIPLCTVGYSLTSRNTKLLLDASYLFFINAFFICASAMIVFRIMKMPKRKGETEKEDRAIKRDVIILGVITIIPSILFAYPMVKTTVIEGNVKRYLHNEFKYEETQVLKTDIDIDNKRLDVVLFGKVLEEGEILKLTDSMKNYNIADMELRITQNEVEEGITAEEFEQIIKGLKSDILDVENKLTEEIKKSRIYEIKEEAVEKFTKIKKCTITENTIVKDSENVNQIIVTLELSEQFNLDEEAECIKFFEEKLGENVVINNLIITEETK